jgi:hypothetical protein
MAPMQIRAEPSGLGLACPSGPGAGGKIVAADSPRIGAAKLARKNALKIALQAN